MLKWPCRRQALQEPKWRRERSTIGNDLLPFQIEIKKYKKPRGILLRVHESWSFLINKDRLSSDESTGLPCACCQGSAGAWCDACAEALAPLLFPCVSVLTLDGAACHGTCTTRRNMHNSHNSSSNHKQVSRPQKWLLKRRNNDNVTSQISTVSLQFICHKGVQVSGNTKHKPIATSVCLCSSHANIICHSSQVASWSLL